MSESSDPALQQVARLEEMAAQTHERAADLYERWLEMRGDAAPAALRNRADRHRNLAAAGRSVPRLAVRTLQGFEARLATLVPMPGKAHDLAVLAGLDHLRRLLDRRIEEVVAGCRRQGVSWAEVGAALRVSRQTAHERYRAHSPETSVRKS